MANMSRNTQQLDWVFLGGHHEQPYLEPNEASREPSTGFQKTCCQAPLWHETGTHCTWLHNNTAFHCMFQCCFDVTGALQFAVWLTLNLHHGDLVLTWDFRQRCFWILGDSHPSFSLGLKVLTESARRHTWHQMLAFEAWLWGLWDIARFQGGSWSKPRKVTEADTDSHSPCDCMYYHPSPNQCPSICVVVENHSLQRCVKC